MNLVTRKRKLRQKWPRPLDPFAFCFRVDVHGWGQGHCEPRQDERRVGLGPQLRAGWSMMVWGGIGSSGALINSGGKYVP